MKVIPVFASVCILCFSVGCSSTVTVTKLDKLESPFALEATRNFQPPGVMGRPEYTIYDGSKWDCTYKTDKGDYVCCTREPFSTMSPWKYWLIVDSEYKPFGFFELGSGTHTNWSGEKYMLFKKIEN
jgi:hypothetical protein